MLEKKINKIQQELINKKYAGLILCNSAHHMSDDVLQYLLLKNLECGLLFIPARGRATFYAISFEVAQLKHCFPSLIIKPFDAAPDALVKHHIRKGRIALNLGGLPAHVYKKFNALRDLHFEHASFLSQIMAVKLPEEIKLLKKAAQITDELFALLIRNWKKFKTEHNAAQFLLIEMAKRGIEPSFPPIIASGTNAALPHSEPQNKKIQKGFCVVDMGVRYGGYCSDMTRTIYIGKPTQKERQMYELVRRAQEDTVKLVKAGVPTKTLNSFCRSALGSLNKEFIHSLGHGVGTQVHEWPRVGSVEDVRLEENMVITIEPGVYRKGRYGIRIEDDVLVKKGRSEVLTKATKKLRIIE